MDKQEESKQYIIPQDKTVDFTLNTGPILGLCPGLIQEDAPEWKLVNRTPVPNHTSSSFISGTFKLGSVNGSRVRVGNVQENGVRKCYFSILKVLGKNKNLFFESKSEPAKEIDLVAVDQSFKLAIFRYDEFDGSRGVVQKYKLFPITTPKA